MVSVVSYATNMIPITELTGRDRSFRKLFVKNWILECREEKTGFFSWSDAIDNDEALSRIHQILAISMGFLASTLIDKDQAK